MTLYLIGIGLGDETDITVKGLNIVKQADVVYLEHYTSILGASKETLTSFYGREIIFADRDLVEKQAEEKLVLPAKEKKIVLLVVGDPFGATTHTDLALRAKKTGVSVEVVHNASIMNAIGVVGLELYKFGKTTSIPFWDAGYKPETPYDVIAQNKKNELHTLCLLDIKVQEPTKKELLSGKKNSAIEPRFMTIQQALEILQNIETKRKENIILDDTLVIGVARLGQDTVIKAGTVTELLTYDFGGPLHSLIVPGKLHDIEEEAMEQWK